MRVVKSIVELAVDQLPVTLKHNKVKRSVFTATEVWDLVSDTEPNRSDLITLGHALKNAGYKRHYNGRVVRIKNGYSARFWILQNCEENWTDADVRADVQVNTLGVTND
tara:strand:+ start:8053 stop:8379 length:327 start_codon:yes stop_codon:yes gene_type:complete